MKNFQFSSLSVETNIKREKIDTESENVKNVKKKKHFLSSVWNALREIRPVNFLFLLIA